MLRVGTLLYGYCGGLFDDNYHDKRVEAVGYDWVVARDVESGEPLFYEGAPEYLERYTTPEEKEQ